MLPLVQVQPCAMSRFTTLDAYPPFSSPSIPLEDHPHPQDATSSFPRAFPIRTSQSHRRLAPFSSSPYPPRSEHYLRRKTPNGTIDAAYDGSPTPPAQGPPPHKHMIIPNGGVASYIPAGVQFHHPCRPTWSTGSCIPTHSGLVESRAGPWIFNEDFLQKGSTAGLRLCQPSLFVNSSSFPNVYQPVIRANEYNVRAFCPPPIPTSEYLPLSQSVWQPDPMYWGYQFGQFPTVASNPPMTGKPMVNVDLCHEIPQLPDHNYLTGREYAHSFGQTPRLNMENLTLDSGTRSNIGGPIGAPTVQLGFRGKALAHAHKAYIDLLTHLQSARKSQQNRMGSRPLGSSKACVYPKPPNPTCMAPIGERDAGTSHPSTQISSGDNSREQVSRFEASRGYGAGITDQQIYSASRFSMQQGSAFRVESRHGLDSAILFEPVPTGHLENSQSLAALHIVARARSSLEVLSTLCEQSGWKWVEGIMLGGCLQYGLENYEIALEWFSRIIVCDPR